MAKSLSVSSGKKRTKFKLVLLILNIVVIAGLAATSGIFFKKYTDQKNDLKLTQDQRNDQLVAEVNKVYALPKDEKPTVAVVSDEQKFKDEYKVFTTAKKDDNLLIYEKAGIAVLYRKSEKKVIGTVNVSIKQEVNVQLLGSDTANAAAEKTLGEKITSGLKIANKSAAVGVYTVTTVVDVSGKQADAAKQIADAIGGTVGTLPAGETVASGVDIVVVLATPATP